MNVYNYCMPLIFGAAAIGVNYLPYNIFPAKEGSLLPNDRIIALALIYEGRMGINERQVIYKERGIRT